MTHVVVDPVTRIEGHLRIEAEVDGGSVREAWSSSTMFRGVELILKGRDPRDAWAFTQRICGVCTTVHAIASIRAVENAIGATPPPNARLLRNLIIASQCVQDHVVHFYHLHALDWVDIVSALTADPAKTAALAQSISDWPLSSPTYFAAVQNRVKNFVERGQLGPFANAYWGHSAYKLPAEANLMAVAHYLEALEWQREVIKIHAVLGGKNPHLQGFLVGGMATPVDPDKQASINMGSIAGMRGLMAKARDFVARVYIPDLLAVASFYKDWAGYGGGVGNYLVYGEYPLDDTKQPKLFLPSGVIRSKDLSKVEAFDPEKITEQVKHSWYDYAGGDDKGLHPVERRDEAPLHGAGAALREARHGREVQLAQVAALRRPAHGGGAALPDARGLRLGPPARQGARGNGAREAQRRTGGPLLHPGPRGRARDRDPGPRRAHGGLARRAGRQHRPRSPHPRQRQVVPLELAEGVLGGGLPRGPARGARSLGPHQGRGHPELPVRRAQHLERGPPGRGGQPRAVRGGSPRDAGGGRREAPRDPAHRPLVRPLHGVRRARRGREATRGRAGEGPMSALTHEPVTKPPLTVCHPGELVRVYVWQWPVRLTHWLNAYAILVLALTGYYVGHPFITVSGPAGQHFVMGWAKTIHSYGAIVFALSVVSRVLWMFMGNRYATWDKFIPVEKRRRRGLWDSLRFYMFQLRQPPGFVGHNPLAGFTYTLVFLLFFMMITTGLALYNVNAPVGSPFRAFHFLLPLWGGAQRARFIHHIGMWLILGFAVHHVYSAVLMSQVEARGTVESMASGYKFVPCEDLVYSGYRFFDQKDV